MPNSWRICHTIADSTAPGSICRALISRSTASRKPSQNTPMFSSSETATVPIWAAAPPSTLALAPASPDSRVVASRPMPTARIRLICLSIDHGKPARRENGTPHTVFSAFCAAAATPRAPKKVSRIPITRATPVPLTVCPPPCA